ncbi:MAG: hypothetical protein H5T86_00040 [Armatimonadetes bacterium]|nr:hypothetical protein [Armatimonadota bacterium]
MRVILFAVLFAPYSVAVSAPELADVLFADGFEEALSPCWRPYDNWSKPQFGVAEKSPMGHGRALRIEFDDKTTLEHYDKGALLVLPHPIPWHDIDFISVRYWIDQPVGNMRIFCHCDKGGWWDYTKHDVAIAKPGELVASRTDFRLAWTDNPSAPSPEQDGRVLQIYFSTHNPGAVNQGERRVLWLDDVTVGTWLLPLRQPINTAAPLLRCWVWARSDPEQWKSLTEPPPLENIASLVAIPCGKAVVWGTVGGTHLWLVGLATQRVPLWLNGNAVEEITWKEAGGRLWFIGRAPAPAAQQGAVTVAVGNEYWQGRYVMARQLTPAEALGLSLRTGAARLLPIRDFFCSEEPVTFRIELPLPWADITIAAKTASEFGKGAALVIGPAEPKWWGVERRLTAASDAAIASGDYTTEVTLAVGKEGLRLTCTAQVEEVNRDALRAAEVTAEAAARRLSDRARSGRGEAWWAREPLKTRPTIPDRAPVDPARWSQHPDPVTWEDLGGGFVAGAQCGIDQQSLATYFDHYDFGRVIKPHLGYFLGDDWRENLKQVAEKGLIVTSVWGYVPDTPWNGSFGEAKLPPEQHEEIMRLLGRRFLGYEMGEQDGRYIGSYAPRYTPATRAEAKQHFYEWHQRIIDRFFGRMVALASLNFQHDYARLGLRMMGIEASQALPSDTMQWAFIRGACKQYGLLGWNCISIFNRWGYKSYTSTGADHGPDKGPSLSLLRRLWYVTYMYGSAINMFESAYFLPEKDEHGFPRLSPVGEIHCDAVRWAREHADRGVLYAPVAIMLHRDAGWVPPRHLYTAKRYLAWGNLPYSRADHATDALFRFIWPGYQDCSYYEDERGYLTPTPYGDMFDVILDDAPEQCLARYQTVILLSDTGIGDLASIERLKQFVRRGGELIVDPVAAQQLGPDLTGVQITGQRRAAQRSVLLPSGEVLAEEPYSYLVGVSRGAKALALSEHGDGILWLREVGKGKVILCCAPAFVAAPTEDEQQGVDVPLKHKLLRALSSVLDAYLKQLALVELDGDVSQIGYLCNVDTNPSRLVVTVVNNGQKEAHVRVSACHGRKFQAARLWLGDGELRSGMLLLHLPAGELAIAELRTSG